MFNSSLYLAFVDLHKAYDSVNHDNLWMILQRKYHLPINLVRVLCMLHHSTRGAVRADKRVSEEFDIITGVRQEDILSPTLFHLFFDAIIATALARHPQDMVQSWR